MHSPQTIIPPPGDKSSTAQIVRNRRPLGVPNEAEPIMLGTAILGYERKRPKAAPKPAYLAMALRRLSEIERLIESRHAGPCDTDDGEAYLRAALPHLLVLPAGQQCRWRSNPLAWCQQWSPLLEPEKGEEWFEDFVTDWRENPRRYRADTIARMLGVRDEERTRLDLRTIGAVDLPKRARTLRRKAKHRDREKQRRMANGATPRELSITALAPWKKLAMSRAAFYRLPEPERDRIVRQMRAQLGSHNQMRTKLSRESQVAVCHSRLRRFRFAQGREGLTALARMARGGVPGPASLNFKLKKRPP